MFSTGKKKKKEKSNLVGSTTEIKEQSYLYYCFGIQSKVEISKDEIWNFLKPLIYNSGKKWKQNKLVIQLYIYARMYKDTHVVLKHSLRNNYWNHQNCKFILFQYINHISQLIFFA